MEGYSSQSVSQSVSGSCAVKIYNNREIIDQIYISCFGISNYPVNLVAKLYKTALLSKAIDFEPIVRFMGEDLSVTLRCLPMTQRLGIISDVVYFYRIGGGTSKFMPYMLEDFLSLYRFKRELLREHPMPQDAEYLIAVELMNIAMTWFRMCAEKGDYFEEKLVTEIKRVALLPEIKQAQSILYGRGKVHLLAEKLENEEYSSIKNEVIYQLKRSRFKRMVRRILLAV